MQQGTYETIDGRPALRFERRYAHPVERVWRAVTEPGELAAWFPCSVELPDGRREGAAMRFVFPDAGFPPTEGSVLELDEPRVFAFISWARSACASSSPPTARAVA
jgi:uncharacterized protein YndB with AHSA1/START domain